MKQAKVRKNPGGIELELVRGRREEGGRGRGKKRNLNMLPSLSTGRLGRWDTLEAGSTPRTQICAGQGENERNLGCVLVSKVRKCSKEGGDVKITQKPG